MEMDRETFFREITLKICGTLDSEKALWQSLMYLRRFMPVVRITFHTYLPDSMSIETIAYANPGSSVVLSVKTPVGDAAVEAIRNLLDAGDVRVVDSIGNHPLMKPVARDLRQPEAACMVMALPLEEDFSGFLAVSAGPGTRFTEENARLLSTTREAFAIALANCLRYREVIALKEELEDESRYYREELRRTSGEEIVGIDQGLRV
jgi:GAF domain-containing protein